MEPDPDTSVPSHYLINSHILSTQQLLQILQQVTL